MIKGEKMKMLAALRELEVKTSRAVRWEYENGTSEVFERLEKRLEVIRDMQQSVRSGEIETKRQLFFVFEMSGKYIEEHIQIVGRDLEETKRALTEACEALETVRIITSRLGDVL